MKRHLAYARYLARHKWFVFSACFRTGAGFWRGLVHDLSKFKPREWIPYSETFYAKDGSKRYLETEEFDVAWLHHQHANPHHWQYWLLHEDDGGVKVLEMPDEYVREMVADWIGAGAAQGKPDTLGWYNANKHKMKLHSKTKSKVEKLLEEVCK